MPLTLITGPARSGKSEWAEQLARQVALSKGRQIVYIATAQTYPDDAEWQARIKQHQQRRPAQWQCEEVPLELADAISRWARASGTCLLIDSLGTWLANLIEQADDEWEHTQQQLIAALRQISDQTSSDTIVVAEETGWGLVPTYELGRRFRDRLGSLSRQVGAIATDVYLATGGYAINISALGRPIRNP